MKNNWPMSRLEWGAFVEDIKKLTGKDFADMDVHRPTTLREIKEVCPQAELDKTEAEIEQKCIYCFGPLPCQEHSGIEELDIVTTHDLTPMSVIACAHNADLKEVVIVGMGKNGREYFASSVSDGGTSMYHLQRGIYKLNKIIDGDYEDEVVGPKPAA